MPDDRWKQVIQERGMLLSRGELGSQLALFNKLKFQDRNEGLSVTLMEPFRGIKYSQWKKQMAYKDDFFETFFLMERFRTIRLIISLLVLHNQTLYQFDVKNTFLYDHIQDIIYIQQPLGYKRQEECWKIWKLKKAIYGLKKSLWAWFCKLLEVVHQYGFYRSPLYHSLGDKYGIC